jgi:hypothetical protein
VAQATIPIMPFGLQGSTVETFTSHVWLANGGAATTPPPKSLVNFSAPGSPTDFGTPDGGGSFLSTDSLPEGRVPPPRPVEWVPLSSSAIRR